MNLAEMIQHLTDNYQKIWDSVVLELESQGKIPLTLKTEGMKIRVDLTVRKAFMSAIEGFLNEHSRPEGGGYSLSQADVREKLLTSVGGRLAQAAHDYKKPAAQYAPPPPPPPPPPPKEPEPAHHRIDHASVVFELNKMRELVIQARKSGKNLFTLAGVDHTASPDDLKADLRRVRVKLHPNKLHREQTESEKEQFTAAGQLVDLMDNNQLDEYRQALGLIREAAPAVKKPAEQAPQHAEPAEKSPAPQPSAREVSLPEMIKLLKMDYERLWNGVVSKLESEGKISTILKSDEMQLRANIDVRTAFKDVIEAYLNANNFSAGGSYSLSQADVRVQLIMGVGGRLRQVALDYENPPKQNSVPPQPPSPPPAVPKSDSLVESRAPKFGYNRIGPKEREILEQWRKEHGDLRDDHKPSGGPKGGPG